MTKPDRVAAALLAALFAWQGLTLGAWLHRDKAPLRWDDAVHISTALDYKKALLSGDVWGLLRPESRPGHPIYPPVAHYGMTAALFAADATGVDPEDAAAFLNFFFLVLLALGARFLAEFWWGREAGLCAAWLAGLFPPFLLHARVIVVDVGLAAFAVWAYAFWARSARFSDRRASLGFAAALALGSLTKWSFPFYVLPALADAVLAVKRGGEARRHALTALGAAAAVLFPWYAINGLRVLPKVMRSAGQGGGEGDPDVWTAASWLWYARAAVPQVSWPAVAASAAGFAFLFARKMKGRLTLAAWLLSGYVFWTLLSNKNDRYILPALAALPLAAAALPRRVPLALAAAAAVFAGWLSWGPGFAGWRAPSPDRWPLEDIVREAASRRDPAAPFAVLTVVANYEYLNGNNVRWTAEKLGVDDAVRARSKLVPFGQLTEFVVVKTGDIGPAYAAARPLAAREEALRPGGWFLKCFEEARRWPAPDGGEAILYQRSARLPKEVVVPPEEALPMLLPGASFDGLTAAPGPDGSLSVRAASVEMKGLAVTDVEASVKGLRVARTDAGEARLLDLRSVHLTSAALNQQTLLAWLKAKAKNLKDPSAAILPDGRIEVSGRLGLPLRARVRAAYSADPAPELRVKIESLRVAGLPLPVFLAGSGRVLKLPLRAHKGAPFDVSLDGLGTEPEILFVGK